MGLIDSHAHLTYSGLKERLDEVLGNCAESGVDRIITVGVDLSDSTEAIALADRHPQRIHAAVGIHPHEAQKVAEDDFAALGDLQDHPAVVAFGEIGLDYHYDFADRAVQRSILSRQLEMASKGKHPLIVHCREAFDDVIPLLCDHGFANRSVVFHCFTGSQREAKRVADQGWRISFTGIVTFPRSTELQEIAKGYPFDELMVETDSPYLSPVPVRNKQPNEPAHIAHTARFLAELREIPYQEFAETTARNTERFFQLPGR